MDAQPVVFPGQSTGGSENLESRQITTYRYGWRDKDLLLTSANRSGSFCYFITFLSSPSPDVVEPQARSQHESASCMIHLTNVAPAMWGRVHGRGGEAGSRRGGGGLLNIKFHQEISPSIGETG